MLARSCVVCRPRPLRRLLAKTTAAAELPAAAPWRRAWGGLRATAPRATAPSATAPRAPGGSRISVPSRRAFATATAATPPPPPPPQPTSLPDLDKVAALVRGARDRLLSHPGLPPEAETAAALRVCAEAADLIMDAAVQPQLSSLDHQADTAASTLLSLEGGGQRRKAKAADVATTTEQAAVPARLRHVVDEISDAAFAVVDEPRVVVTPGVLAQYVQIQARLGRPESLPRVLHAFAAKPVPVAAGKDGSVTYRTPRANRLSAAVDAEVAETALATALAARNLDAAVGVVEHTLAAAAHVRAKLVRKGVLPAFVAVGVPLATWSLATQLAAAQQTMEPATATGLAFAAILAYIAFTGTIGVVANTTANDQMRRVTWAPGTPLRERWLREDERAALDRVACAFGFSEAHRYGEEEGAAFAALREYIMRKGMLLDQIELMEGMGS